MKIFFCFLFFGLSALADVITVGASGNSINGDPFAGPLPGFVGTRYQQVYSSADFPHTMAITSFGFYNDSNYEGPLPVATYQIFFSTVPAGIDTLSNTNFDSNDGPDNTLFASVNLSGSAPSQLIFAGQPFNYNPADGNLLMDIHISNELSTGGAYYDSCSGTAIGIFSRYQDFSAGTKGFGLVTQFTFAPVPEPSTIVLLLGGLAVILACRKLIFERTKEGRGCLRGTTRFGARGNSRTQLFD